MSWNAGGGARKLPALLDELGYHVFAAQEAHQQHTLQLDSHKWVLQRDQRIVARKPNEVQTIDHGGNKKIQWHVAEVLLIRREWGSRAS